MKFILILILNLWFGMVSWAQVPNPWPDIQIKGQDIPHLRPGLPVGTIAWVLPIEIQPSQPQVGENEIERKKNEFEDEFKKKNKDIWDFSNDFLDFALKENVSPAYIVDVPTSDSRHGKLDHLAIITDRNHGAKAQSLMLREVFGNAALSEVFMSHDKESNPLNWHLVKVMGDLRGQPTSQIVDFLSKNGGLYLKKWSRGEDGSTQITPIHFDQLPETPLLTTNNPYRDFIGDLQHRDKAPRIPVNYSQFLMAEGLIQADLVKWDDIANYGNKDYDKTADRVEDFFKSKEGKQLVDSIRDNKFIETTTPLKGMSCQKILSGL